MIGTAAGTGDDAARRIGAQAGGQRLDRFGVGGELAGDDGAGLCGLGEHQGILRIEHRIRHLFGQARMSSSATKS